MHDEKMSEQIKYKMFQKFHKKLLETNIRNFKSAKPRLIKMAKEVIEELKLNERKEK